MNTNKPGAYVLHNKKLLSIIGSYIDLNEPFNLISKEAYIATIHFLFLTVNDLNCASFFASRAWEMIYKRAFFLLQNKSLIILSSKHLHDSSDLLAFIKRKIDLAAQRHIASDLIPKIQALKISLHTHTNQEISTQDYQYLKNLSRLPGYKLDAFMPVLWSLEKKTQQKASRYFDRKSYYSYPLNLSFRIVSGYDTNFDDLFDLAFDKPECLALLIERYSIFFTLTMLEQIPIQCTKQMIQLIQKRPDLIGDTYIDSLLHKSITSYCSFRSAYSPPGMHPWAILALLIKNTHHHEKILSQLSLATLLETPVNYGDEANLLYDLLHSIAFKAPEFFSNQLLLRLLEDLPCFPAELTDFMMTLSRTNTALFNLHGVQELIKLLCSEKDNVRTAVQSIIICFFTQLMAKNEHVLLVEYVQMILNSITDHLKNVSERLNIAKIALTFIFRDTPILDHISLSSLEEDLNSDELARQIYGTLGFCFLIIKTKSYYIATKEHIDRLMVLLPKFDRLNEEELLKSFRRSIRLSIVELEIGNNTVTYFIFKRFILNRTDLFDTERADSLKNSLCKERPVTHSQCIMIALLAKYKTSAFLPHFTNLRIITSMIDSEAGSRDLISVAALLIFIKPYLKSFDFEDQEELIQQLIHWHCDSMIRLIILGFSLFFSRKHIDYLIKNNIHSELVNNLVEFCGVLFSKEDVEYLLEQNGKYFPFLLAHSRNDLFDESHVSDLLSCSNRHDNISHSLDYPSKLALVFKKSINQCDATYLKTLSALAALSPAVFNTKHVQAMQDNLPFYYPIFAQLLKNQSPVVADVFASDVSFTSVNMSFFKQQASVGIRAAIERREERSGTQAAMEKREQRRCLIL